MGRKNKFLIGLVLLTAIFLTACSGGAKSEKDIANDIAKQDSYFEIYNLKLDDYEITKRQTNKDDKTDYVWITITGNNSEFEYTAEYEAIYVLYNDGWLLEECDLISSEYKAISKFDSSDIEAEISQNYKNLSLISKNEYENKATLTYIAEKQEELYTLHYEMKVDAEFKPAAWKVVDVEYVEKERELNIVGEWMYEDNGGRYYYMHISEVKGNSATINYLFVNTAGTDEWNYISSEGYQEIEFNTYHSNYTGTDEYTLYFHLKNGNNYPSGKGGDIDFGWLWLKKTSFVDGKTYCGFTINEKYLTRKNSDSSPVIGIDETKKSNKDDQLASNENMTDAETVVAFLNKGDIEGALAYISTLTQKTEECQKLEKEINEFVENYGDLLGRWVEDYGSDPEEFLITCRYDGKLILCMEIGETIEGERKLFDLAQEENNSMIFHSNRFDSNKYHFVKYSSYSKTIKYYWQTDDGLKTIGTDYIKK